MIAERAYEPVESLDSSTCWSLLRTTTLARIGLVNGEDVEVLPVNVVVDGGTLVFRTASGTKLELLHRTHRATIEADGVDIATGAGAGTAWSVVVKGVPHIVRNVHEVLETFDLPLAPAEPSPKGVFVRLEPDSITGRRFAIADAGRWESEGRR